MYLWINFRRTNDVVCLVKYMSIVDQIFILKAKRDIFVRLSESKE